MRQYGIAALTAFFVGMIVMLLFGLFGIVKLGAVLWVSLTLLPILLFWHERRTHRHDALYEHGHACSVCRYRWLPALDKPPRADPEIRDRLRVLGEQRAGTQTSEADR